MLKFLHANDNGKAATDNNKDNNKAKTIAIPCVFSENNSGKNFRNP